MSIILIDICVITDLANPASLEKIDQQNTFIINCIIYAECAIGFEMIEEVEALFKHLNFSIKPIPKETLFLAGKVFLQYERHKGSKTNVLPDFFIGAHAAVGGYKLMIKDKAGVSAYFPSVELIIP